MKFWELYSICRQHEHLFEQALTESENKLYLKWLQDIENICKTQQRDKLDAILPESICISTLSKYPERLYESSDRIRSYKFNEEDIECSYIEIYQKYGGAFLEEVLEKGSMTKERRK